MCALELMKHGIVSPLYLRVPQPWIQSTVDQKKFFLIPERSKKQNFNLHVQVTIYIAFTLYYCK